MPKKRKMIILAAVLAVSLVVSGIAVFATRATMRQPTQQEMEACAPYTVDWQAATGLEGTDREIILSLCTFVEEKTIGENVYQTYRSDTLGTYLYDFQTLTEIAELNGILYVQYYDGQGALIMLAYDESGMTEKGIYAAETDTYYYEYGDTFEVWTNFRKGAHLGF